MLNGLDPILIFSFYKNASEVQASSGVSIADASFVQKLSLPPIPIYLSEKLTGIYIESEEKNIDIDTNVDSGLNAELAIFTQKPINSSVKITMNATKDSVGLSILSAMADLLLPKITAKNYDVTYLNGASTVFGGLIHSFAISQEANSTLMKVVLEIIKVPKKSAIEVTKSTTTTSLNNIGSVPTAPVTGSVPPTTAPVPKTEAPMPLGGPT